MLGIADKSLLSEAASPATGELEAVSTKEKEIRKGGSMGDETNLPAAEAPVEHVEGHRCQLASGSTWELLANGVALSPSPHREGPKPRHL